jgi:hypothetical protein
VADPPPGVSGALLFSAESSRGTLDAWRVFFGGRGELLIAAISPVSSGAFGVAGNGEEVVDLRSGGIAAIEMRWERRVVAFVEWGMETMVRYGWMRWWCGQRLCSDWNVGIYGRMVEGFGEGEM